MANIPQTDAYWVPRLEFALGGLILGILIMLLIKGCDNLPINKNNPNGPLSTSDTIYRDHYVHDTIKDATPIIPKIVTKYLHDTLEIAFMDTVFKIKTEKGDTVYYPITVADWGLLGGKFTRDSIILDLYDSTITRSYWSVNYDKYRYEWVNGRLKQSDNPGYKALIKATTPFYTESSFYGLYDPFNKNTSLAIDYSVLYKRVGLYGRGSLVAPSIKNSNIQFGLKIKLK